MVSLCATGASARAVGSRATQRCVECAECLCAACFESHSRGRASRNHSTSMIEVPLSPEDDCPVHDGEPMDHWCGICRQVLCLECAAADHGDHGCELLHRALQTQAAGLNAALAEVRSIHLMCV